jgi:hypothetical protein
LVLEIKLKSLELVRQALFRLSHAQKKILKAIRGKKRNIINDMKDDDMKDDLLIKKKKSKVSQKTMCDL